MESCNGKPTASETGVATTITSSTPATTVSTTAITSTTSQNNGGEDEDSNFDRLTQMLPECFVSVKLENNEDTCTTETSANTISSPEESIQQNPYSGHAEVISEQAVYPSPSKIAMSEMQNSQQSSTNVRSNPSFRFHHRGTTGCTSMPEIHPWLQHCYTTSQMSSSDSSHQGAQHFHQSAAYLANDSSIAQSERSLKPGSGVARLDGAASAGIGGLSNGDICDSNTFLNYVLNQQRSSGIFLFDPIHSFHPNDSVAEATLAASSHESNANSDSLRHQNVDHKHAASASLKHSSPPSSVPSVESNPARRDASTNTVSKYSQTVPAVPLHVDAKTNTGDCSDDSDTPVSSVQAKPCPLHHCTKCVLSKITHMCQEHNVSTDPGFTCQKVRTPSLNSENGKFHANFVVVSSAGSTGFVPQPEQRCTHGPCNCSIKMEGSLNHGFCNNDNTAKFGSMQIGRPVVTDCKCVNDCSNICIKDNRRLHYVDIDRPFTCEICLKNYPTSTALMNHMRYHRGQRPYQCEVCNKAFATNSHLVTHRRVHTGERPFQCRLCRRSFADRSAYVKHERTHGPNGTIIKRYKCDECGNAFVDSCGLKKHVRIHTGERPYSCSVCQKTFSTSSTFVAHKRIHSGERPYKCENCDKMFITKSHLLTHRRTHTGEKPFSCQVCNRAFADGSSFRRHERLHTGENRHTCDICGKGFPFDTSLAKHKESHIPGTPTYVYMV